MAITILIGIAETLKTEQEIDAINTAIKAIQFQRGLRDDMKTLKNSLGLKPCPFCGKEPKLYPRIRRTLSTESIRMAFEVECENCGTSKEHTADYKINSDLTLSPIGEFDARDKVYSEWNTREYPQIKEQNPISKHIMQRFTDIK